MEDRARIPRQELHSSDTETRNRNIIISWMDNLPPFPKPQPALYPIIFIILNPGFSSEITFVSRPFFRVSVAFSFLSFPACRWLWCGMSVFQFVRWRGNVVCVRVASNSRNNLQSVQYCSAGCCIQHIHWTDKQHVDCYYLSVFAK